MPNKNILNFWVMPNAGFSTRPILQETLTEFENLFPNTKVSLTVHPWSLGWQRVLDVVKGRYEGPLPDVLQVGTTWIPTLAYLGILERAPDSLVMPDEAEPSATIWDPGNQDEAGQEFYCVPWFIDVRVLYYRRDVFATLGLSKDMLQDWHGFLSACAAINEFVKRSKTRTPILAPLAFPGQKPAVLMHDLAPWVWAAGGDFCSPDLTQATLTTPTFFKGCDFFFDLVQQGLMPLRDATLPSGNFFTGQYAMQFSGSWPRKQYLNSASPLSKPDVVDGFDVAMIPAGPHGRYTFLGGSNLAVSAKSPQKELAWQFIRFMSEPTRQQRHAGAIGALPARVSGMENLFAGHASVKRVFLESFNHARRLPRLIELGSVERIISEMSGRVLGSIRDKSFTPKRLKDEIAVANADINAVISLHGYASKLVHAGAA